MFVSEIADELVRKKTRHREPEYITGALICWDASSSKTAEERMNKHIDLAVVEL